MKSIGENIKVAFKSLSSNKLRAFLTMLGIIIGVGAVVAVMSVGAGAEAAITANMQNIGTNVITISPGRASFMERGGGGPMVRVEGPGGEEGSDSIDQGELYLSDATALKKQGVLIKEVAPMITGRMSTVRFMSWDGQVSVTGTTEDFLYIQGYEMKKGSFITAGDVSGLANVAVIGSTVVENFFGKINPVGEIIKIDGKNFTVIGVLESVGSSSFGADPDNAIYMPITTAQHKLFGMDIVSSIAAKIESEEVVDEAIAEAEDIIRVEHKILPGENNDFQINSPSQFIEAASSMTEIMTILLASIAAISLLVGGIGIMNIMFVSVTERTREIGVRKAIGAKNRDIMIQFLTESIVLSFFGGLLGVGMAFLISWGLKTFTTLSSVVTATPVILALAFSTAIGLVFGIFPAMRAARLNPIESLRYE